MTIAGEIEKGKAENKWVSRLGGLVRLILKRTKRIGQAHVPFCCFVLFLFSHPFIFLGAVVWCEHLHRDGTHY